MSDAHNYSSYPLASGRITTGYKYLIYTIFAVRLDVEEGTRSSLFFIQINSMIENRIAEVLNERFQEDDLKSCFLVGVSADVRNKVTVFVDADDQLTIGMCQKISRFLEHRIEENKWLPDKYTLDVSSPGTDNPLKLHRQYKKNIGRTASVKLDDGSKVEGKIEEVQDDHIKLLKAKGEEVEIPFEKISETKILVSFK